MEFRQAFKNVLALRGLTYADLAERAGVTEAAVGNVVMRGNPRLDALCAYLARAGYDVALVPAGARLPEGSYRVEVSR